MPESFEKEIFQFSSRASTFTLLSKWKITVNFTFHVWRRPSWERKKGSGQHENRIMLTIILSQSPPFSTPVVAVFRCQNWTANQLKRRLCWKTTSHGAGKEMKRNDCESWKWSWGDRRKHFCMTCATLGAMKRSLKFYKAALSKTVRDELGSG